MSLTLITDTDSNSKPTLWVVLTHGMTRALIDPGTGKPWRSLVKARAEVVAKEVGGAALPLREAIRIVSQQTTLTQEEMITMGLL